MPSEMIPQERISERTEEQIVEVPVPQTTDEIAEFVKPVKQEHVQQRTVEEIAYMPVSQTQVQTCEEVKVIPREQVSQCIREHWRHKSLRNVVR